MPIANVYLIVPDKSSEVLLLYSLTAISVSLMTSVHLGHFLFQSFFLQLMLYRENNNNNKNNFSESYPINYG